MARKQFSGTAIDTTLAYPVTSGQMTIVTDDYTGWPTTGPYVMALSYGSAGEEKVLISSRSLETHTVSQRGYDGTTASSHDNGAAVAHVLDATTIDEVNDHVNNDQRDDHSQYLNTERHDVAERHVFGDALGTPVAPEPIGTVASEGSGDAPAREDHTHRLATSSIDTSSLFVAGVVNAAALATDAVETLKIKDVNVTTGKIADYAITTGKINTDAITAVHIADGAIDNIAMFSGAKPVVIASAQPTGVIGMTYYDTDENRLFAYDGTAWRWIGGKPYAGQIRRTSIPSAASISNNTWEEIGLYWSSIYDYATPGEYIQIQSGNPNRLRAPVTGLYEIGAIVYWAQDSGGDPLRCGFYKGGSYTGGDGPTVQFPSGSTFNSNDQPIGGTINYLLDADDIVRLLVKQQRGTALDVTEARFWIRLIAPTWS